MLPKPHAGQREAMGKMRRFNVVACGRRWGKTTLGILRLSNPLLMGQPCGWFAPNYKYLTEAWRDFNRVLKPIIRLSNASEKRLELITGGSLDFWTLEDPDSGRSRKYQRVVIDEAAKARHLELAWNEAIQPTLTNLEGDADFYSTPKGLDFFWKAFTWGTRSFTGEYDPPGKNGFLSGCRRQSTPTSRLLRFTPLSVSFLIGCFDRNTSPNSLKTLAACFEGSWNRSTRGVI